MAFCGKLANGCQLRWIRFRVSFVNIIIWELVPLSMNYRPTNFDIHYQWLLFSSSYILPRVSNYYLSKSNLFIVGKNYRYPSITDNTIYDISIFKIDISILTINILSRVMI